MARAHLRAAGVAVLAGVVPVGAVVAAASSRTPPGTVKGSAPFLGVLSPSPAAPRLPLYVTGNNLGHVVEVLFTPRAAHGRLAARADAVRTGIEPERNTHQFAVIVPLIAAGSYELSVRTRVGISNGLTLHVVTDGSLRRGATCPSEWVKLVIDGASNCQLICGTNRRWKLQPVVPARAPAGVSTSRPPGASGQASPPTVATAPPVVVVTAPPTTTEPPSTTELTTTAPSTTVVRTTTTVPPTSTSTSTTTTKGTTTTVPGSTSSSTTSTSQAGTTSTSASTTSTVRASSTSSSTPSTSSSSTSTTVPASTSSSVSTTSTSATTSTTSP